MAGKRAIALAPFVEWLTEDFGGASPRHLFIDSRI